MFQLLLLQRHFAPKLQWSCLYINKILSSYLDVFITRFCLCDFKYGLKLQLFQKKNRVYVFFLQCSQSSYPINHNDSIFLLYLHFVISFILSEIHQIIIIIDQIVESMKIQRRCWPLTYISVECTKANIISVSIAWNSRDLIDLELSPAPHMFP